CSMPLPRSFVIGVTAHIRRERDHRRGEGEKRQADETCVPAEKIAHPLEGNPAQGSPGQYRRKAKDKLGISDISPKVKQPEKKGRVCVGQARFVCQVNRGPI